MELRAYLRLIRRGWIVLVASGLLGLSAAGAVTVLQPPKYEAVTQAFISTGAAATTSDLSQGAVFTQQVVKSYAEVAQSALVLDYVVQKLRLAVTSQQLAKEVTAAAPLDTSVLEITVQDSSPRNAARIANAITDRLTTVVSELNPSTTTAAAAVKITRIEAAVVPEEPAAPRPAVYLPGGLVLGLLLGFLLLVLLARLDTKIRTSKDASQASGLAVLGAIPFDVASDRNIVAARSSESSSRSEAFRTLRTNLRYVQHDDSGLAITITSSISGEGKSTTAINLAVAIADTGARVLLVDADLRRPKIAEYLNLEGAVGLSEILIGAASYNQVSQNWAGTGLAVIASGAIPPNPSELLNSTNMAALMTEVRAEYDVVIVDAPPLLPVSDAAILSKLTTGALLVCAVGKSAQSEILHAVGALRQIDARVLGLVMTMMPVAGASYYHYAARS